MTAGGMIIHLKRFLILGLCLGLGFIWAAMVRSGTHKSLIEADFAVFYYTSRCALEHADPYDPEVVLREFEKDKGRFGAPDAKQEVFVRTVVTVLAYPPTILLVVAPLAALSWPIALTLWLSSMAALLVLAAFLMWDTASEAPVLAGCITCYMLFSCIVQPLFANPSGVVVPFAVISAWCFLEERYALAGVVLLALSLVMKPQVAGFLWLYFLLAGGTGRKRAMQTLAVVVALGICTVIWITPSSPHWVHEMQRNFAVFTSHGGGADPGPSGLTFKAFDQIVSLQSAVSIFRDDPRFYNPVTYAVVGSLILFWIVTVLRKRTTRESALLALAAISILGLLPVYHASHDAKLLLLTIPACATLWVRRGAKGWVALGLTIAAIVATSDVPMFFWPNLIGRLPLGGKLALFAVHPAPLVLLATGCFYLWVYIRYKPSTHSVGQEQEAGFTAAAS